MPIPNDPLVAQQWHLQHIGNIGAIWREYTGQGVTVGVYDDAIQTDHPDLAANYRADLEFVFGDQRFDPAPVDLTEDGHGTAVAGLIAAARNGIGGVGVAYGASITGVPLLTGPIFADDTLAQWSIYWAANMDIMSNSWGREPQFYAEQSIFGDNAVAQEAALFAVIAENGRGGLGTIIVQSAGNERLDANGDGLNVSRHSITVAATDEQGLIADYSNFGPSILVAAPAGAYTADLTDGGGYNLAGEADGDSLRDLNYTGTFGGTSAAAPVVSGVIALMLDAAPDLGWRDVQNILARSAAISTYNLPNRPIAEGTVLAQANWNGGGALFSEKYGFGIVDAYAAVRMAEVWTHIHGGSATSASEVHASYNLIDEAIVLPGPFTHPAFARTTFAVAENIRIETVYVTIVLVNHVDTNVGFWLESPDGHKVALTLDADLAEDAIWTFALENLRGMESAGDWVLVGHQSNDGYYAFLADATVSFFGSTETADDVHTFTKDFLILRRNEPDRAQLRDIDGGIDWLNLAAIAGDIAANLAPGGAISVNGKLWTTLYRGIDRFERIVTGDGSDRLTGNGLDNHLLGMRGNDILTGAAGNDLLRGGSGNDVLNGSPGNDSLHGGNGRDTFVFMPGGGRDRVADFLTGTDRLQFDDALWGGGKRAGQVVASYASVTATGVLFDFGDVEVMLAGLTSTAGLPGTLLIV